VVGGDAGGESGGAHGAGGEGKVGGGDGEVGVGFCGEGVDDGVGAWVSFGVSSPLFCRCYEWRCMHALGVDIAEICFRLLGNLGRGRRCLGIDLPPPPPERAQYRSLFCVGEAVSRSVEVVVTTSNSRVWSAARSYAEARLDVGFSEGVW